MYKKVKRVLVLGVLALFAALVYAEGEQETGIVSPKESNVTVREEKSKSSTSSTAKENTGSNEIGQATKRGNEKHSRHSKKKNHTLQSEEIGENFENQTGSKNNKEKENDKNKTAKKDDKQYQRKNLCRQ